MSSPEFVERGGCGGRGGRVGRERGGAGVGSRGATGGTSTAEEFPTLPSAPAPAQALAQTANTSVANKLALGTGGLSESNWADEVERREGLRSSEE